MWALDRPSCALAAVVKLITLVIPLGLDTFAVAAALGILGTTPATRLRVSILFGAFEAAMPLVAAQLGLRLGHRLGERLREGAERLAGLVLSLLALALLAGKLLV